MKEKKLVVKNVIGGLEEKRILDTKADDINSYVRHKERIAGHNQLCNREVEVDVKELAFTLFKFDYEELTGKEISFGWEVLEDADKEKYYELAISISKGISQGKVLKITKEE